MKSFDDVINDKVNEGLVDKWRPAATNNNNPSNYLICQMLLSVMEKLDEIEAKLPYRRSADLGPG